jgi:hypothetical protein
MEGVIIMNHEYQYQYHYLYLIGSLPLNELLHAFLSLYLTGSSYHIIFLYHIVSFKILSTYLIGSLPLNELLHVFLFLDARDVCRCAMVAGKWHRVSETPGIWTSLGVRRYR